MIKYILKFIVVFLVTAPFYLAFRRPWKYDGEQRKREFALAVFVLYVIGLLALTLEGKYALPAEMFTSALERISNYSSINLVPFKMIKLFFVHFNLDDFLVNIVSNVVIFIPWGFGLVLLWKSNHKLWKILLFLLLLTVFIESCQLFICRNVDIDDVILNFLGGCLGTLIYFAVRKKFPVIEKLAK